MTATVKEMSLYQKIIDPTMLVKQVVIIFDTYSYLQSCVIAAENQPLRLLSKKRLMAALSKPYVRELYADKPLDRLSFVHAIDENPLTIDSDTPIAVAVSLALSRELERCYDPMIVNTSIGPQTLEVDLLLRAQSRILQESVELKERLLTDVRNSSQELRQAVMDLEIAKDRLEKSEASLELQVHKRTRELETVNANLVAQQDQIQSELQVARTLQQSILPNAFPHDPRFEGRAYMHAARMIGGDFFDVFKIDEHHLGVVVADVSGKGVPAALFMVLVRTMLQEVARHTLTPSRCLTEVNEQLLARNPLSLFVTMLYGVLDARTGKFVFSNGGHTMPYVLRSTGAIEMVSTRGSPLVGLLDFATYVDHTVYIGAHDRVLMITDGVTEYFDRDDQAFGEARLLDFLAETAAHATSEMIEGLIELLERFSGGIAASDDVTILGFEYLGAEHDAQRDAPFLQADIAVSHDDSSPLKRLRSIDVDRSRETGQ